MCERDDDCRGGVFVSDMILDDETRSCLSLFRASRRVEFHDHNVSSADLHSIPLWSVAKILIAFPLNAIHFIM